DGAPRLDTRATRDLGRYASRVKTSWAAYLCLVLLSACGNSDNAGDGSSSSSSGGASSSGASSSSVGGSSASSSTSSGGSSGSSSSGSSSSSGGTDAGGQPLTPGDSTLTITAAGKQRSVLLHVPGAVSSGKVPLVIALHGNGDTNANFV